MVMDRAGPGVKVVMKGYGPRGLRLLLSFVYPLKVSCGFLDEGVH